MAKRGKLSQAGRVTTTAKKALKKKRRRAGAHDSASIQERLRVEREMGMRRGKKK